MDSTSNNWRTRSVPPLQTSTGCSANFRKQGLPEDQPTTQHEVQLRVSANPNPSWQPNQLNTFGRGLCEGSENKANPPATPPVWAQRIRLVVMVMFCVELGMLLAVLPWTRIWLDNALLASHAGLQAFVRQNFIRGAVSGLGLVDIWIGISEAVYYRESKPKNNG